MFSGSAIRGRLTGAGTPFNWPASIGYDRQPFANLISGPWKLKAGPNGLQIGLFGWVDPNTGQVSNAQIAGALIGFVLPVLNWYNWQRVYPNWVPPLTTPPVPFTPPLIPGLILRPGVECVVGAAGDFVTTFLLGGQAGQRVYVDPATGFPYSGNPGGLVATPWTVMQTRCECNARLRISSFASPTS